MEERSERLVALRKALAAYEAQGEESASERLSPSEMALGCALKRNALHEVYARDASSGAVAAGFAAGIAMRLGGNRPLFWITTDYATLEYGGVTGSGFLEFGIDPRQLVFVRLPKDDDALRAAGDILSCAYIGAVVLEIEGKVKTLDLVTSRRISLAAADRNIPAILLRLGSPPMPSAAETRWLVHAAPSPPPGEENDWGRAAFDVRLLRNRHGQTGEWRMEWDGEYGFFRGRRDHEHTPHSVGVASAPANGSVGTQETARRAII